MIISIVVLNSVYSEPAVMQAVRALPNLPQSPYRVGSIAGAVPATRAMQPGTYRVGSIAGAVPATRAMPSSSQNILPVGIEENESIMPAVREMGWK